MAIAMLVTLPQLNLQFGQVFFGDSQSQICFGAIPLLPLQGCCFLFRVNLEKPLVMRMIDTGPFVCNL